jgi:hypothetical protein
MNCMSLFGSHQIFLLKSRFDVNSDMKADCSNFQSLINLQEMGQLR